MFFLSATSLDYGDNTTIYNTSESEEMTSTTTELPHSNSTIINYSIKPINSSIASSINAITFSSTSRTTVKATIPTLYMKTTPSTRKIIRVTRPRTLPLSPTTTRTTLKQTKITTRKTPMTPSTTLRRIKASTPIENKKKPHGYKFPPRTYFKTSPTTARIVKKTTAYFYKPIVRSTKQTFRNKNPYHPKESEYNDFIDVTIPKDNDETLFITPAHEKNIVDQYSSEEVDREIKFAEEKNFRQTLTLLTQTQNDTDNNNIMAIVVSSIGTVVFVIIVIIVIMKYYRYPRQRTLFSSSISQSDVRFFPNDENLDFSLDNDLYGKL